MGTTSSYDTLVVGCGLMGSAVARALAAHGHTVAAWNRTAHRAEALAEAGVTPVASLPDAVPAARLCIAVTDNYDSLRAVLETVTDWSGTTLVNLVSGPPEEAEAMAAWAAERGAAGYLDGFIVSYPKDVGAPHAMVGLAGPSALWKEHRDVLLALGGATQHVSESVRGAGVLEGSMVGAFYIPALSAYVEAVAYAVAEGISPQALAPTAAHAVRLLADMTPETATAIADDVHTTDQATVHIFAEGTRATRDGLHAAGFPARLVEAALANLEAAERAGHADLGFSAQARTLNGPEQP